MESRLPSIMIDSALSEEIELATGAKVKCAWNGRLYYGVLSKIINSFAIINTRDARCTVNVPLELVQLDV